MSTAATARERPAWLGYVLVLVASTLFGLNAGVSRIPLRSGTDADAFTSVRITGGLLVLVLVALATRQTAALRPPRGREIWFMLALGLVGIAGLQLTYNIAINRLPLGIALLLEYLGPVLVALWTRFALHRHVHPRVWPALGLTLVGLAVVGQVWDGLSLDGLGVGMALAAAVCFATYFLMGEHPRVTADLPLRTIIWAFVGGAIVMNLVAPFWTARSLGVQASALGRFADLTVPAWAAMAWVIVLGTVAPFFLLLLALRLLPATVVSVTAMFEPVMAVVVGWVWFDEALSPVQTAGVVAVLVGIVLAQTARVPDVTDHPDTAPTPLPPPG